MLGARRMRVVWRISIENCDHLTPPSLCPVEIALLLTSDICVTIVHKLSED